MDLFVLSFLGWRAVVDRGRLLQVVLPCSASSGETITACLGKCCDLMLQIIILGDERCGFFL